MKNKLLASMMLLCALKVSAQDNSLGKIAITSPESAAIAMYNNYPIDYGSGVPNIEVPLFEINTKAGKIPFKLSYHIGSIKPSALTGIVGFGWTMSPNMGVTRSVNGGVDGVNSGFKMNQQLAPNTPHDNAYKLAASQNNYDEQPDDFYYSLIGKSGQFIYKNDGTFATLPFDPIIVAHTDDQSFTITDDDGTIYKFGKYKNTAASPITENSQSPDGGSICAWKITEIIPFDQSDDIKFTYGSMITHTVPYYNIINSIAQLTYDSRKQQGIDPLMTKITRTALRLNGITTGPALTGTMGYQVIWPYSDPLPDNAEVKFDVFMDGFRDPTYPNWPTTNSQWNEDLSKYNGTIPSNSYDYGYTVNSPDIETNQGTDEQVLSDIDYKDGHIHYQYDQSTGKKLISVTLYDKQGLQIKNVSFSQSDLDLPAGEFDPAPEFTAQNKRFELDAVNITGGQLSPLSYKFDYTRSGTSKVCFGVYGNYNSDFWGFYNGGGDGLEPSLSLTIQGYWTPPEPTQPGPTTPPRLTGALQMHNVNLLLGSQQERTAPFAIPPGILHSIQYPTGGTATFEFENNEYESSGQPATIVFGAGYRINNIKYSTGDGTDYLVKQYKYGVNESGVGRTAYKLSAPNFLSTKWVRAVFPPATSDDQGASTMTKITTLNSKPFLGISFSSGAPVLYPEVAEYSYGPQSNSNLGKTVYRYFINEKSDLWLPYTPLHADTKNDWKNYRLLGTDQYKFQAQTNSYVPVHSTNYTYTDFSKDVINAAGTFKNYDSGDQAFPFDYAPQGLTLFPRIEYQIQTGVSELTSVVDNTYEDNAAPVTQTTNMEYDPVTFYKKHEVTTKSDGRTKETIYRFINNKSDVTGLDPAQSTLMDQMLAANRLKNGLETLNYTDSKLQRTIRQQYDQYPAGSSGVIYPSALLSSTQNFPLEENVHITKYDAVGNVLERLDRQSVKTAYQWGYNKAYPVAMVTNAGYTDIWFDGLEEATGTGIVITPGTAHTGHNSESNGYSKALTNLTNGTYTLTYWKETSGVWSLVTVTNIAVTTGSYPIAIPNTYHVDDICFYPSAAQMTTYTYDPLVGMTSTTDAKGETSYYEYDSFQRLVNIKDKDGNIIRHTDYHYQGQ